MNTEPVYNIGVVARMTGIPENTLRVWERRYDFPQSDRTEGGHRLYSPREVLRIQWVKQRIDEGMQTRNAVRALEQVEAEGRFPESLDALQTPQLPITPTTSSEAIRKRLFQALSAHDTMLANQIIGEALALHSLEHLILNVISPTLTDIGRAWLDGRMNTVTEHFATNHLRHQLLMWMQTAPPASPVPPVVLACAPGELHEGGLIMLGVLLRRLRWPVIYLGQTVALPDLVPFFEELKPSIVVFAAMTEDSAEVLCAWPQYFGELADGDRLVVAYGGYLFTQEPAWIDRVPGTYLGDTLSDGLAALDRLLRDRNLLLR